MTPLILCAAALFLSVIYLLSKRRSRCSLLLPPTPPDGAQLPKTFAYRYYHKICEICGPVWTLPVSQFSTGPTIIVGGVDAAIEILEKNGAASADRPRNISGGEILSGGMRTLITPQGERLRKMRKALHVHLTPQRSEEYIAMLQTHYAKHHVLNLVNDPENHQGHSKLYAAALVLALTYGVYDVHSYDDPRVEAVSSCLQDTSLQMTPGLWKVDRYPWLRYVPGYLKPLRDHHQRELNLFRSHFNITKQELERNPDSSASDSFAGYLLKNKSEHGLSDNEMAYLAGSMFGAGSDTSAAAITNTIQAAILYPRFSVLLRDEMRRVFNKGPPTLEELLPETTPFLHAYVYESLRWRPVSAPGFPHKVTKDIHWENYVIPKGATVYGSTWAIARDPKYFENADEFNPTRWIITNPGGEMTFDENMRAKAARSFGWGRRICPGNRMATRSILLNAALVHWAFDMEQDPNSPVDPLATTTGVNVHPLPFKVVFSPRKDMNWGDIKKAFSEGYGELDVHQN